MKKVLKLHNELTLLLKHADECCIAVALLSNNGLDFLEEHLPETCKTRLLVGIDLPTPASVFERLLSAETTRLQSKVYNHPEQFFHPKVYLIRQADDWTAFVGSGNFTQGGLSNNIEMSLCVDDSSTCNDLLQWFETYYKLGTPLTSDWVTAYGKLYENRKQNLTSDRETIQKFKSQ